MGLPINSNSGIELTPCLKGIESEHYDIKGSVLGSLLFIIYSNDIPNARTHSKMVLFADDTTVYCIGKNIHQLLIQMNQDLLVNSITISGANQLPVNASKTKYILIEKQRSYVQKMLNLTLNDEDLERTLG